MFGCLAQADVDLRQKSDTVKANIARLQGIRIEEKCQTTLQV